jgi:hypothetical protein
MTLIILKKASRPDHDARADRATSPVDGETET